MGKRSLFSTKYNGLKVKVQLVREGDCRGYDKRLSSSEDVVRFVGPELKRADREYFLSIFLNAKNVPLGVEEVSIGSLDLSIVHPREAMKSAVLASAAAVVFVHNLCGALHKLCYVKRRVMWSIFGADYGKRLMKA